MESQFADILMSMLTNPPDPNTPVPFTNKPSAIYGITITFQVFAWIFVIFRLYVRLRVVREPGWDDVLVAIAACFNGLTMAAFFYGVNAGLGHHLIHVLPKIKQVMMCLYLGNAGYASTSVFIKMSLLCQYLRLFRTGLRRILCCILLVTTGLWGAVYMFMAWFPCFPVHSFWNRLTVHQPVCYGFGYRELAETKYTVLIFSAFNMFFDLAIFSVPLSEYMRPGLRKKEILAMTGLFSLGTIVITMATLRLWWNLKNSKMDTQTFDFTWWFPGVLIISSLEIDFAIMCASMPIFWPSVLASWNQIFIVREVEIVQVTHQQSDESTEDFEMGRQNSLKSHTSQEGLTRQSREDETVIFTGYEKDRQCAPTVQVTSIVPHNK